MRQPCGLLKSRPDDLRLLEWLVPGMAQHRALPQPLMLMAQEIRARYARLVGNPVAQLLPLSDPSSPREL